MVIQGELLVKFESAAKAVGELVGGFSTTAQKKQPEGDPTKLGMVGGLGAKALMGSEGFGGLKKSLVGMTGPIGKMGGALMKGGVIGMATAGISSIMGIVSKALGGSSIFTGVAAQFWKIAGVMVDVLLMPLLPIMMKFIQWMMSTVMPEIMKLSTAIGRALQGDIGPIVSQIFKMNMEVTKFVMMKLPRMLLDVIQVAVLNALPGWMGGKGGALTVKEHKEGRETKQQEKEVEKERRSNLGTGGKIKEGFMEEAPVQAAMGAMKWLGLIGEKQKEFGDNMVKDGEAVAKNMTAVVDKERNLGKARWSKFENDMYKNSILPGIKDDTYSYLETLSTEAENSGSGLFSWVNGINWGIFGTIGTSIKDAAKAVWGAVTGFFSGKDEEGKEVKPNLMSVLPGIPDLSGIIGKALEIGQAIKDKAKAMYSSIMGFFTGKDSEGKEVTPNLMGYLPDLPDLSKIIGAALSIGATIKTKAKEIWTGVETFFTVTLPGYIPSWDDVYKGVTTGITNLGSLLETAKTAVVDKVKDLWGSWNPSGIMGIIPNLLSNIPGWDTVYGAAKDVVGGIGSLLGDAKTSVTNILKGLWGQWTTTDEGSTTEVKPHGIAGIIPSLLSKIPSFSKIFSLSTYKDLGTLAKNKVSDILGSIWGDWGKKTGIAGLIPNLMSKIPDIGSMMGDLMSITIEGVSRSDKNKLVDQFGGKAKRKDTQKEVGNQGKIIDVEAYDVEIGLVDYLKQIGSIIKEKAMVPVNWVKDKYNSLKSTLGNLSLPDWDFGDLLNIVKNIANAVLGGINKAICWIVEKYNATIGKLGLPSWMGGWSASISSPPQIPKWHTGGIVPGGPSAQVPAILQGGEQVIPRSERQMGGGGGGTVQTFNININSTFAPGDIIRSIVQSGATDEVAYLNTVG